MVTMIEINEFLAEKTIAVAGASRNPKKFGGMVLNELTKKGYNILPVNPNAMEISGISCYHSVLNLPADVKNLYIVTPKSETAGVVAEAIQKGIAKIWIQQKSETEEALEMARKNNIPVISNKCIFMFTEPVESFHKFHRFFARLFGNYPKN